MNLPHHDRFSVALHWLMALLILAQLGLGLWMVELPKDNSGTRAYWFNQHKSMGMLLLCLVVIRLAWIPFRPRIEPLAVGRLMSISARASHALLYVLMLVAPLSGFLGSVFSKYPIRFFGIQLPRLAEPWELAKETLSVVHNASTCALLALIGLHLAAVVYHQCVRKDGLLRRMR